MKRLLPLCLLFFIFLTSFSFTQIGYFLGDNKKISSDLNIEKMSFNIKLEDGFATVKLTEIVKNDSSKDREGFFFSRLLPDCVIDDFVIYRNLLRLPAVIMTKKKARKLYDYITWFERDPGLLQTSYTYSSETNELPYGTNKFSVSIYPIPSFGYKRMEFSYIEPLKYKNGTETFILPLSPKNFENGMAAKNFEISISIKDESEIASISFSPAYLDFKKEGEKYTFKTTNFSLNENIKIKYKLNPNFKKIYFSGYLGSKRDLFKGKGIDVDKNFEKNLSTYRDGYFLARKFTKKREEIKNIKNLFILADFSLSMKWANIKKLYLLLNKFIENLNEKTTFNIYLFNRDLKSALPSPQNASLTNKKKAEEYLNNAYFIDGTDVLDGIKKVFEQIGKIPGEKNLILIGDFIPTYGEIDNHKILEEIRKIKPQKTKILSLGIGENINDVFLKTISEVYLNVNSIDNSEILDSINEILSGNFLTLKLSGNVVFFDIYPSNYLKESSGSLFFWFGRFKRDKKEGILKLSGNESLKSTIYFKNVDNQKKFIPKMWAKSKIDYLLKKISEEGENEKLVKEVVKLSKEYKIITPYTSMLAAPRSFLRPRFIQPGDPIIKVKAPSNTVSVNALLPTGENLNLNYIKNESTWAGKFILPPDFKDGKYLIEIVLRNRKGEILRERKTINIDTHPPIFKIKNLKKCYRKGEILNLKVNAPYDTKEITAILSGSGSYEIKWNNREKICEGNIKLPTIPGRYTLKVISQDFAQNLYSKNFILEIK